MANLRLYPHFGTIEQAKSLKFEIQGLSGDKFRINIEDATQGNRIDVESLQNMKTSYTGVMNLNIPVGFSQSAISIFAHIEERQEDGLFKTIQICPAVFSVEEHIEESDGIVSLTPSFIGPNDVCRANITTSPNEIVSLSIGKAIFRVVSDGDGAGQIHFKGVDVIKSSDADSVQRFPVYLYSAKDNFTSKKIGGAYLNMLPHDLAVHATLDPRCDLFPSGSWVIPPECLADPNPPIEDPVAPVIPPIDIPSSCTEIEDSQDACKIFNNSVTLLNNGMVLYAYASPDDTYSDTSDDRFNVNRVFIASNNTSVDVQIIATEDVVIESKDSHEDFRVHVSDALWDALSFDDPSGEDIYVVFFSAGLGFQKIRILGRQIDEYTGVGVIIGDGSDTSILINSWLFCINAVFYHASESPSLYIGSDALPYIQDTSDNYLSVINVSITSNVNYIGSNEESYVYIVAEALLDDHSQLFFYSFSLSKNSSIPTQSYGWKQLTHTGNNRLPKVKVDSANNLHVIWESDRGTIDQLYYGIMGASYVSVAASALSASVDKYADFASKEISAFSYQQLPRMQAAEGDAYDVVPEHDTQSLLEDNEWSIDYGDGGEVKSWSSQNYLDNLTITANAVRQNAMAFQPLKIVLKEDDNSLGQDPSASSGFPYLQYNYQVAFDMVVEPSQNNTIVTGSDYSGMVIDDKEADKLIDTWIGANFTVGIDATVDNQPVYVKRGNKFVMGRRDNVFDRIVPILGSYMRSDPSVPEFQIKILKKDNNLKDFTIALMLEKIYVTVTNIENLTEYMYRGYARDEYIESWTETIYTGRGKFVALIKTEDTSDERADYIIVREFPEVLNVNELARYSIIVNYTGITSDEVSNMLNTQDEIYSEKFLGTITMLVDGTPKFSQTFISTLNYDYRYFDIGFGIPYGGYYIADKMTPSKLGVFDNVEVTFNLTDISITSPTFEYNSDIITVPPNIREATELRVKEENTIATPVGAFTWKDPASHSNELLSCNFIDTERTLYYLYADHTTGQNYSQSISTTGIDVISVEFTPSANVDRMTIESNDILYDTGYVSSSPTNPIFKFNVDVSTINIIDVNVFAGSDGSIWSFNIYFKKQYENNSFIQVPITIEGVNQSADIDVGICNDVHVAWQSNRDRYWNIFYTSSVDMFSPFRFDMAITDTKSNSLKPSISVCRNGSRMISWHDNRKGNYNVYMARSIEGYSCDVDRCARKMLKSHEDEIIECTVVEDFNVVSTGIYNFSIEFYSDNSLTDLYKTISIEDAVDRWFLDGVAISDSLVYDGGDILGVNLISGDSITLSYAPDKNDNIFDRIFYVKLESSVI